MKVRSTWRVAVLYVAYLVIFFVSLTGNSLICLVIYRTRRLHTVTNVFIANLAISDLFITVVNIPFNVVRHFKSDWIFGHVTCGLVNFALAVFVYVSTFTMTAIAVDRYVVIIHPLRRHHTSVTSSSYIRFDVIIHPLRPRMSVGIGLTVITVTWCVASLMSLPFAIFAQVLDVELFLYTSVRCSVVYPAPSDVIERIVTLTTFVIQYAIPVVITLAAYCRIAVRLCGRTDDIDDDAAGQVGSGRLVSGLLATRRQKMCHERVRRRSIVLLAAVVIAFTVSWLPLNVYHIITDFHPDNSRFRYNGTVYLTVHWVAVSSVCCNPLAYCWLNASFRTALRTVCSRSRSWSDLNHRQMQLEAYKRGGRAPVINNVTGRVQLGERRREFGGKQVCTAATYERYGNRTRQNQLQLQQLSLKSAGASPHQQEQLQQQGAPVTASTVRLREDCRGNRFVRQCSPAWTAAAATEAIKEEGSSSGRRSNVVVSSADIAGC